MSEEERCVWLAQCVCPNGHTIMAYANEAQGLLDAKQSVVDRLHQHMIDRFRDGTIALTCFVCKAHRDQWRFCVARTPYATMVEAQPHFDAVERRNALKRHFETVGKA